MGMAPECDPGQEQIWSTRTNTGSSPLALAAVAPPGISFARYCYDMATLVARGSNSGCQGEAVDLSFIEYKAIVRKQINERITAYQIAGLHAHRQKPHAMDAQFAGTAVSISNGGIFVARFTAIKGCTALSLGGAIVDVIAVDAEDDVAALVSVARAGVVTSFRARPPRRTGEPMLAIAYEGSAGEPLVASARVFAGAETAGKVVATIDGASPSLGNGALLLDDAGNTTGLVLAPADSSSGKAKYLTAKGLGAILDFWGLPYQVAESVASYPDEEVANWGKSTTEPIGCWRKP
jgi:hypothetical protein